MAFHVRAAGAGLTFEHMYSPPHRGLLLWLPHLKTEVKGISSGATERTWMTGTPPCAKKLAGLGGGQQAALIGTGEMNPWMSQGEGQRILD